MAALICGSMLSCGSFFFTASLSCASSVIVFTRSAPSVSSVLVPVRMILEIRMKKVFVVGKPK